MALDGCYFCIKYLVFAFNFVFWLLGCVLVGVGLWARFSPETLKNMGDKAENPVFDQILEQIIAKTKVPIYIIIAIGVIIMVIGFFGCCGAIKESKFLLGMFFIFLLIIFSAILALAIYVVVHKDKVKDHIEVLVQEQVDKSEKKEENSVKFMHFLQNKFKCCGAMYGIEDYQNKDKSQCKQEERNIPCVEELYKKFKLYGSIISGVAVGVAFAMILGMIFSMLLCCAIREQI